MTTEPNIVAEGLRATANAIVADATERAATLRAAAEQIEQGGDPSIPVARLAKEIGAPVRAVTLAGKRDELEIRGPRCARVVRRSEADRWIASHRPRPASAAANDVADERADARASVAAAAARAARGRR